MNAVLRTSTRFWLAGTGFVLLSLPALAQVPQARPDEQVQASAQAALAAATKTLKGKAFPAAADPQQAQMKVAGQSFCDPYDMRSQLGVAELSLEFPKQTRREKSKHGEATYSPPLPIWVISSYTRTEQSNMGPVSFAVNAVPGGYHSLTNSQFTDEFTSTKNYVATLNIPPKVKADLTAKLEEYVKNYQSYAQEISASHGSIMHSADIKGAGIGNGRTLYRASFTTTEVCAPAETRDVAALDKRLKSVIAAVVATQRRTTNPELPSSTVRRLDTLPSTSRR
jgi:hypothetical protein